MNLRFIHCGIADLQKVSFFIDTEAGCLMRVWLEGMINSYPRKGSDGSFLKALGVLRMNLLKKRNL